MNSHETFRAARDLLIARRSDYDAARRDFRWPRLTEFNWALDWFDRIGAGSDRLALWLVEEDGRETTRTYQELVERSNRLANWLRSLGVRRGDRVIVMLGNQVELWESLLACMKLGAVIIPATTLLTADDLRDRVQRGEARHVITTPDGAAKFDATGAALTRIVVGEVAGWETFAAFESAPAEFAPDAPTGATDPLLLYFTSGTTAKPKLVEHTHVSYPVGHLTTMYWLGLQPGDVHLNIASPGWAKHAWSNFFAPWIGEATVLVYNYARFDARALLDQIVRCGVTTFCAPPTVWRMLIQQNLRGWKVQVREAVSAGEPLNPEVIDQVQRQWGLTIRDGYGQTETTLQVANSPGQRIKPGSMGRAMPGFKIDLVDPATDEVGEEGEICIDLGEAPIGMMAAYRDDPEKTAEVTRGGRYHTGDVASRDADGYITYVGRADDVFKASDYRISPFELESVLIEHEAVAEAAVVPSPDPMRLNVPKAFVVLAAGHEPSADTARSILKFSRERLAPYKRIRRLEFAELPKTISGKIRRVELRELEAAGGRQAFSEEDFDLK